MTPEERLEAELTRINIAATPVQMGQEIRVLLQMGGHNGITFTVALTQDAARAVSKILKDAREKAEVMLVKPEGPKLVAEA